MVKKKCFKCGESKPYSEFYRHPEMGDGHLGKCKVCTKADVIKNRADKVDKYRAYDRMRFANDPNRRERTAEKSRKWAAKYPDRRKAQHAVNNAVRDERLIKSDCESCGSSENIHGHHDDYSKTLSVRWLCAPCHAQHHAKER